VGFGLTQLSGKPALHDPRPRERARESLFLRIPRHHQAGRFRPAGGQIEGEQRIAHPLIVTGIEFQHALENRGGSCEVARFGQ
jgi:hypothetical protein